MLQNEEFFGRVYNIVISTKFVNNTETIVRKCMCEKLFSRLNMYIRRN